MSAEIEPSPIGRRIREVREAVPMAQAELARRVGVSQQAIYALEAGNAQATKHLPAIARELGVTVEDLDESLREAPTPGTSLKAAIHRFMFARGLKVAPWCERAGISEGTLRNFLAGTSATMTHQSLVSLAEAAGATLFELLGAEPPPARKSEHRVHVKADWMLTLDQATRIFEIVDEGKE